MYEIWLMLNIITEIAWSYGALIPACAIAWLALMVLARRRLGLAGLRQALLLGGVTAVLAFFALPGINRSSLADMTYWVDWFNLAGWALTAGAIGFAVAFPLVSLLQGRTARSGVSELPSTPG